MTKTSRRNRDKEDNEDWAGQTTMSLGRNEPKAIEYIERARRKRVCIYFELLLILCSAVVLCWGLWKSANGEIPRVEASGDCLCSICEDADFVSI
jgi:t-SNARE complex subunit (syntaxin)